MDVDGGKMTDAPTGSSGWWRCSWSRPKPQNLKKLKQTFHTSYIFIKPYLVKDGSLSFQKPGDHQSISGPLTGTIL
jgi:hypothetical protein